MPNRYFFTYLVGKSPEHLPTEREYERRESCNIRKYIVGQIKRGDMKYSLFVLLLVAVLLTAGCTNENKNIAITPAVTVSQTPILPVSVVATVTEKPIQNNTVDRNFIDAVEICYNNTPVIIDTKTNLAFTICMQHIPIPTGECAKHFRSDVLKYATKDDSTTAGFKRETHNMQAARAAFYNNTRWDSSVSPPTGGWVKC